MVSAGEEDDEDQLKSKIVDIDADIKSALHGYRRNPQNRAAYIRRRNALYAQRKYHKKKLAIVSLTREVGEIKDCNKHLGEENKAFAVILDWLELDPPDDRAVSADQLPEHVQDAFQVLTPQEEASQPVSDTDKTPVPSKTTSQASPASREEPVPNPGMPSSLSSSQQLQERLTSATHLGVGNQLLVNQASMLATAQSFPPTAGSLLTPTQTRILQDEAIYRHLLAQQRLVDTSNMVYQQLRLGQERSLRTTGLGAGWPSSFAQIAPSPTSTMASTDIATLMSQISAQASGLPLRSLSNPSLTAPTGGLQPGALQSLGLLTQYHTNPLLSLGNTPLNNSLLRLQDAAIEELILRNRLNQR